MKTQTDGPMKSNEALEIIRGLPSASIQVPRDGYLHKRAIAAALGATHLDKPESQLVVDQDAGINECAELDAYVDIVHGLAEDHALITFEKPFLLGYGGSTTQSPVYGYDVIYTVATNQAVSLLKLSDLEGVPGSPIATAEDLLELIEEEGRLVYHTWFEPGAQPYRTSLPQYCGEDLSSDEKLRGFRDELLESGRISHEEIPYLAKHMESKGAVIDNVPATVHILRAA